jgi:hypothetical protein
MSKAMPEKAACGIVGETRFSRRSNQSREIRARDLCELSSATQIGATEAKGVGDVALRQSAGVQGQDLSSIASTLNKHATLLRFEDKSTRTVIEIELDSWLLKRLLCEEPHDDSSPERTLCASYWMRPEAS